jgi:hypothetical protein
MLLLITRCSVTLFFLDDCHRGSKFLPLCLINAGTVLSNLQQRRYRPSFASQGARGVHDDATYRGSCLFFEVTFTSNYYINRELPRFFTEF